MQQSFVAHMIVQFAISSRSPHPTAPTFAGSIPTTVKSSWAFFRTFRKWISAGSIVASDLCTIRLQLGVGGLRESWNIARVQRHYAFSREELSKVLCWSRRLPDLRDIHTLRLLRILSNWEIRLVSFRQLLAVNALMETPPAWQHKSPVFDAPWAFPKIQTARISLSLKKYQRPGYLWHGGFCHSILIWTRIMQIRVRFRRSLGEAPKTSSRQNRNCVGFWAKHRVFTN